ncbi:LysR substrate-binding domain-containing protein [Roseateles sp. BYS180W]|uniref:LysR substrate-binding domain-containing protein n=1 Tax=Roseateles rivi TaxID=3299028 RepID=A0ABW7FZG0_9BURK
MSTPRAPLEPLRPALKERLPPLNALRAFEVAARQRSFAAAARELFVTPGAVSLHVKQLEDYLEVRLFVRESKGLRLTAEGERYLPLVAEAFARLRQATQGLRGRQLDTIHLAARPLLAQRWLLPRLNALLAPLPHCHVELETELDRDPQRHTVWLDYLPAQGEDLCSEPLFTSSVVVVAAPAYLAGLGLSAQALDAAADWRLLRLLHDRPLQGVADYPHWLAMLQALGVEQDLERQPALSFANGLMALEAACQGLGVALAPRALVGQDLQQGRLVLACPPVAAQRQTYHLVWRRSAQQRTGVAELLQGLRAAALTTSDPD